MNSFTTMTGFITASQHYIIFLEDEVLLLRLDYMELNHDRVNWPSFVGGYSDAYLVSMK